MISEFQMHDGELQGQDDLGWGHGWRWDVQLLHDVLGPGTGCILTCSFLITNLDYKHPFSYFFWGLLAIKNALTYLKYILSNPNYGELSHDDGSKKKGVKSKAKTERRLSRNKNKIDEEKIKEGR